MSNAPLVTSATGCQQTQTTVGNHTKGISALLYAAQQGDVGKVRRILRAQPNGHLERDRTGKSALHYCCTSDHISAAQAADILVMAAPDLVDSRDDEGFTPLHLAVIAGNMPLVTFLLANNADVNAVDNEKHTVVHWATVCGETVALRAVLTAGAPVSTPDVHGGYPLHYAAQMCGGEKDPSLGLQVLYTLLSHEDINVSVEDGDGRPPLLWAASAGSAKAVLALIKAGSSVESHDKDGLTALHCAASRGRTDCIDTLLTLCGASADVIDSNGCTALHYAVTLGHADATALLLSHNADPNRQDRRGRSPAHCGCAKGQFETVKMLNAHRANLWLRNARGDLPLHEAAASGRRDLVRWLLESRPSQVNARNNDGRCPLHLSALNDNADMCKILIDAGAHINPVLRTSKNVFMTPIDCALQRGFRSTAKYLQVHGGVPANRLTGVFPGQAVSSAVSLQIRDDVTLWGGTSSEGESENIEQKKIKKKMYKRKLDYKHEKQREPISLSDLEPTKLGIVSNLNSVDLSVKDNKPQEKDTIRTPLNNGKNLPSEIIIYANEVNINDVMRDIKIQRNGKILDINNVSHEEGKNLSYIKNTRAVPIDDPKVQNMVDLKSKEKQINDEDVQDPVKSEIELELESLKNNQVEINPMNEAKDTEPKEVTKQIDQQAARSNSSYEDEDNHKEMIVEVSVHSPPKEMQIVKKESDDMKKEDDKNTTVANTTNEIEIVEKVIVSDTVLPEEDLVQDKNSAHNTTTSADLMTDANNTSDKNAELIQSKENQEIQTQSTTIEKLQENVSKTGEQLSEVPANEANGALQAIEGSGLDTNKDLDSSTPIDGGLQDDTLNKINVTITSKNAEVSNVEKTDFEGAKVDSKDIDLNREKSNEDAQEAKAARLKQQNKGSRSPRPSKPLNQVSDEESSSSFSGVTKKHKSFKVLNDDDLDNEQLECYKKCNSENSSPKKRLNKEHERLRRSKIPTPIVNLRSTLSKSDRYLERYKPEQSNIDVRVPSLPNIYDTNTTALKEARPISNLSAPLVSTYSDRETGSEGEDVGSATRKKKLKKRLKTRNAKSAGSGYESSNLIDSGFEPSPRSVRYPKTRYMTERGVNMTSVTQTIQTNIRRYHLERKIFQHLLDLKRLQIRSGQHNEAVLVKRAVDGYHRSCAATVGAGRYLSQDYTFKNFEAFLYNSLRKIQKNGSEHLHGLPETPRNPLHCTQSTHRCDHATHAYTGVPCAAYLPKMNHHNIPKIGFECKPSNFLPKILPKNAVTLELCHGNDKQVISLPAERLDQNKRYYVTFTVKGSEEKLNSPPMSNNHLHSKSE